MEGTSVHPDSNLKESTCIICGKQQQEGIMIYSTFLCMACETEIVKTDVMDAKYPYFIDRMKQIWFKRDA